MKATNSVVQEQRRGTNCRECQERTIDDDDNDGEERGESERCKI